MKGRLSTKLAMAMVVVAVVTAALTLPAAIIYTEHRLDGLPASQRDDAMAQIERNSWDDFDGLAEWAAVSVVAGAAAVGIGWLLARRITRPLLYISAAARHLADGDLDARTGLQRRDELGRLARDFDTMAEDLQRLEDERRIAAAATAHELRTPVTIVRARLQAAQDGLLALDDHELAVLIDQLDGLGRIVEDLRVLSLATAGRLTLRTEPVELRHVITSQVAALALNATDRDVELVIDPGPLVTVEADRERLAQVITNLTVNAIRHSPSHGEVRIACARRDDDAAGTTLAEITVADGGPGFPPELGDPFAPFATGHAPGNVPPGSGLGLAIVAAIVDAHGGSVRARNQPSGATVTVTIPARTTLG